MGTWSITINDLDEITELPANVYDKACGEDADLQGDALGAFVTAKERGLVSATIAGGRTPSPYGGPDTVTISIVGFNNRNEGHANPPMAGRDFNSTMLDTILAGGELEPDDPDDDGYLNYRGAPHGD
jgi:hypothetical protein